MKNKHVICSYENISNSSSDGMYVCVLQLKNTQNNTVGELFYSTTKVTVCVSNF